LFEWSLSLDKVWARHPKLSKSLLMHSWALSSLAEMNDQPRTEAQDILVVVDAVIECGHQVVGFHKSQGNAGAYAQIESTAHVGGKG
jgi:hypothetical protein